MKDFIVVGLGFAGISFSHHLLREAKKFVVYDKGGHNATKTSAALYNPVILKRFTPVWRASEQLEQLQKTFSEIEKEVSDKLNYKLAVYRKLASIQEQNEWFMACDKPQLSPFMSTSIRSNDNPEVKADFGLGEVLHTGRIDTRKLTEKISALLDKRGLLRKESFDYASVEIYEDRVIYKGEEARAIVFCEGFGLKQNPYFSYLPVTGCKGEVLTIRSKSLRLQGVLKGNGFIIPLGDDLYKVGSTYDRKDFSEDITPQARELLLERLNYLTLAPFEVLDQQAAIRPTVSDRRPLVGVHPEYQNVYVINGLGTRGSMIGPYAARVLYEFIFHHKMIPQEMDIHRFRAMYKK